MTVVSKPALHSKVWLFLTVLHQCDHLAQNSKNLFFYIFFVISKDWFLSHRRGIVFITQNDIGPS